MIQCREINLGSPEYKNALELRTLVLRIPLGLQFTADELKRDKTSIHFGAFDQESLVGCLILSPTSDVTIKMRQVAVQRGRERSGIGRALVKQAERKAKALGYKKIELSARAEAIPFYLALGYETQGERFTEVGIDHQHMQKTLT